MQQRRVEFANRAGRVQGSIDCYRLCPSTIIEKALPTREFVQSDIGRLLEPFQCFLGKLDVSTDEDIWQDGHQDQTRARLCVAREELLVQNQLL